MKTKNVNRFPDPEDLRLKDVDWIAEFSSLDPDRSLRYSGPLSSWDSLCLIYLVSHVACSYWITEDIIRMISNKAYSGNYEGEWKIVQFFLEQDTQSPEEFYKVWLTVKSPEEFFGNLRKRAMRMARLVRSYKRESSLKKPRTPQRTRGYKDKGTLRPPHTFHGDPPVSGEKLDYRSRVKHPLIYEEDRNENHEEDGSYQTQEVKT